MFKCDNNREDVILVIAEIVASDRTISKEGIYFQVAFRDTDYFSPTFYKFDQETMNRNLFNKINWDKKYVLEIDTKKKEVLNVYEKLEVEK